MLFLNRRGYAPLTLCRACGHRLQCPNCTAWLVEHRCAAGCNATIAAIRRCRRRSLPGLRRRRTALPPAAPASSGIAEEVAALFPGGAASRSWPATPISGPDERRRAASQRMADREIDLLIGTQIVAKGHHFPMLTLVGVVDADLGLCGRRPARGRAHVPAAAPGGGPRRPRRSARPRAAADLSCPSIR